MFLCIITQKYYAVNISRTNNKDIFRIFKTNITLSFQASCKVFSMLTKRASNAIILLDMFALKGEYYDHL